MIRKWWIGLLAGFSLAMGSVDSANAGCWWRCHGRAWGPVYGHGWCYRPYVAPVRAVYSVGYYDACSYRSYYALPTGCWPSYSYYSAPVTFYPHVIYSPIIYSPAFTTIDCFSQSSTVAAPTTFTTGYASPVDARYSRAVSNPTPRFSGSPTNPTLQTATANPARFAPTRWAAASHPAPSASPASSSALSTSSVLVSSDTRRKVRMANPGSTLVTKSDAPRPIQPYSPIWTESAVGLLDDLMDRGEWAIATESSQRLEKIPSALTQSVLLRQAIFELVTHRDTLTTSELERVLHKLDYATIEGSELLGTELRHGSISLYLEGSTIPLDSILDPLSKQAMEHPESSSKELLLIAALLTLDGQPERASVFAREARAQAAMEESFPWQSLLRTLTPVEAAVAAAE